jgi:hypothetical protein
MDFAQINMGFRKITDDSREHRLMEAFTEV